MLGVNYDLSPIISTGTIATVVAAISFDQFVDLYQPGIHHRRPSRDYGKIYEEDGFKSRRNDDRFFVIKPSFYKLSK